MKAITTPAAAKEAAEKACFYWQKKLAERTDRFIQTVAARRRGFFDRRPNGEARARLIFGRSVFEDGQGGGAFWTEYRAVETCQHIINKCDRAPVGQVMLDDYELSCLRPVAEEIEQAFKCTRCGRGEIEARSTGCARGPCPMEPVE